MKFGLGWKLICLKSNLLFRDLACRRQLWWSGMTQLSYVRLCGLTVAISAIQSIYEACHMLNWPKLFLISHRWCVLGFLLAQVTSWPPPPQPWPSRVACFEPTYLILSELLTPWLGMLSSWTTVCTKWCAVLIWCEKSHVWLLNSRDLYRHLDS